MRRYRGGIEGRKKESKVKRERQGVRERADKVRKERRVGDGRDEG